MSAQHFRGKTLREAGGFSGPRQTRADKGKGGASRGTMLLPINGEKKMKKICLAIILGLALSGCGTGTDGVVSIGPDMYMIGGLGRFTDFSASAVKARFFQQAQKYCADQGRVMVPMNSTGKDSDYGTYASAEVQFKCVATSK